VTNADASPRWDMVVIGGGIVGLATAMLLLRAHPGLRLRLLEKDARIAQQQSGHNSGVLHTGIYYVPGSLKARTCVEGHAALRRYCEEHGIEVRTCGKLVVACEEREIETLRELERRGTANGVPGLEWMEPAAMRAVEPHVGGVAALHVPGAAILDFGAVCASFANEIRELGGEIETNVRVQRLVAQPDGLAIEAGDRRLTARHAINCGGLYADRLARAAGVATDIRLVPFRGEYVRLRPERRQLVRGLVYPAPRLGMPFLGVHFTPKLDGEVEAGPNAVLAFAREGYRRRDVSPRDLVEMFGWPGFWRMGARLGRLALAEAYRSFWRPALVRDLRKLVPSLVPSDLVGAGSGVRAQAVDASGRLVDDF
jgi:L-2-hydroxyglutarate oxidase